MLSAFGPCRDRQALYVHPEYLTAQEPKWRRALDSGYWPTRAVGRPSGSGNREPMPTRRADAARLAARPRNSGSAAPIRVGALRATGVVAGSNARPQLFKGRQRAGLAVLVHDGATWPSMPVRSLENVDEVDAEGLFGLNHLPILTAAAPFQLFAEPPHLIRQRLVGGRTREEPAHLAHAVRRRPSPSRAAPRMNSPNCCNDVSSSRIAHLRPLTGNRHTRSLVMVPGLGVVLRPGLFVSAVGQWSASRPSGGAR